jgi:transposase
MQLHANARTCPNSRARMARRVIEEGWSLAAAAEAAGVSERTAAKWVARFRSEGRRGPSTAPRRRGDGPPAPRLSASRRSERCAGCA